jgi:hypothetical protein
MTRMSTATSEGRNDMRRKLIATLLTLVACTGAGSTAVAAPNAEQASCMAILTSRDVQLQIRDDTAREVAAEDFPPGELYSVAARATGTTEEECEAALGP